MSATTEAKTPARRAKPKNKMWAEGVHIAPFLSPAGRLVLVGIGRPHYVMVVLEATALEGSQGNGGDVPWNMKNRLYAASSLQPFCNAEFGGSIPVLTHLSRRAHAALLWPRGVHFAPWRSSYMCGAELGFGRPMIAIDKRNRMVAEMIVPDGEDTEVVRAILTATLEAFEETANDRSITA